VRFLLDEDRPKAGLEDVPAAAVAAVETLSVDAVHLPHREREVGERRLEQQVVMAAHQAVAVAQEAVAIDSRGEQREEAPAVGIVEIHVLAVIDSMWQCKT